MARTRRPGRPAEPLVTSTDIARVAYDRLRTTSPRDLRMTDIADDLGVRAPSLYHHLTGKDDILNLVRDAMVSTLDTSVLAIRPPRAALLAFARGYVEMLLPLHPETVAALVLLPYGEQPRVMAMYDAFTALVAECGVPEHECLPVLVAMENFCVGAVLDRRAPADYMAPSPSASDSRYAAAYRAAPDHPERAFDLGIDALVAGLCAHYPGLAG